MFPSLYLLTVLSQFTASPKPPELDRATVQQAGEQGQITWSDAEDKVTGTFAPSHPEANQPIEGPVTLTLSPQNGPTGASKTVSMNSGSKAWAAQLHAGEAGAYWLEVGYTTTRRKVVRAEVMVNEAKLPRWPWWAMTGVAAVVALAFGVRSVIGKKT